jgi:hypothetical protein
MWQLVAAGAFWFLSIWLVVQHERLAPPHKPTPYRMYEPIDPPPSPKCPPFEWPATYSP